MKRTAAFKKMSLYLFISGGLCCIADILVMLPA